jgi:branched-chain amino acid transport system permease protein
VFHRIALTFTEVFGGDYGISIERPFSKEGIYFTSILLMAGTLIAIKAIVNSRVGMALKSIREDEDTARAVGINVKKYKLIACLISAFFTSLAGICGLYDRGHVGPEIFSMHGSFNVVIMAIIGGVGTVYGAALGGGLLSILLEFMRPIAEFRTLIYSILLVFIVMMAPAGIWGGIAKYLRR